MELTVVEKINVILKRKNMTKSDLARKLNQTPQNIIAKLNRDNLKITDVVQIADALDCTFEGIFTDNETHNKI